MSRKGRPSFAVDGDWRRFVYDWLEKHPECSQAELARSVDLEPASLNQLLKGKVRQSWAVPFINEKVGLPVPTIASGTIDEADVIGQLAMLMAQLDGEDEALVRDQLESAMKTARHLAAKRRRKDS
jgi:hypothetical protein